MNDILQIKKHPEGLNDFWLKIDVKKIVKFVCFKIIVIVKFKGTREI